ncbi:MAG TPA: serine/threonine protein kinase, partial [Planctomycetes bacterium]|nr:serine/threonine protein kinase [Planctomycetota bacterium]
PVALKLLHDTDPDMRRRFAREARTLARLRHPNLLAVTDMGEVEGVP